MRPTVKEGPGGRGRQAWRRAHPSNISFLASPSLMTFASSSDLATPVPSSAPSSSRSSCVSPLRTDRHTLNHSHVSTGKALRVWLAMCTRAVRSGQMHRTATRRRILSFAGSSGTLAFTSSAFAGVGSSSVAALEPLQPIFLERAAERSVGVDLKRGGAVAAAREVHGGRGTCVT